MLEQLFSPLQRLHTWLDQHPGVHHALGLLLLAAAVLAPWPAWMLDVWILVAWGVAGALAVLLLMVGAELQPREALRSLPGFLRRLALHRLALSLALTKAILLGTGAGAIVEWVAHQALRGHVGVGLSGVGLLLLAQFSLARSPFDRQLSDAQGALGVELARIDASRMGGELTPSQALARETALREEIQILTEGEQVARLLRGDAWLAVCSAVLVVGAGLVAGLAFKAWPVSLTLTGYTVFTLAELIVTALPALVFAAALSHWMTTGFEASGDQALEARGAPQAFEPAGLLVELGRELATQKRLLAEVNQLVKHRVGRELGLPLARVEWLPSPALEPRGYRVVLRGVSWANGELEPSATAADLAEALWRCVQTRAGDLLTPELLREWLNELANAHPFAVAESINRLGWVRLHGLLQALLRERVPLRDMVSVLEAAWASGDDTTSPADLLEAVRQRLALVISLSVADANGTIPLYQLSPDWLSALAQGEPEPWLARELGQAAGAALNGSRRETWGRVAILVPRAHRPRVAAMLQHTHPDLAVVSAEELSPHYGLRVLGTIERRIKDLAPGTLPLLKLTSA